MNGRILPVVKTARRGRNRQPLVHRIAVLVHETFTDSGLGIALDVFRAANALRMRAGRTPLFEVEVLAARAGRVRGAR